MLHRVPKLGIRDVASWPVFWVTLVGNALLPGLLTSQVTGLTLSNRLTLMVVTQIAVWTVIIAGGLIAWRLSLGSWAVVLTAVIAAVMRGIVISGLLPLLGIASGNSGPVRVLMSTTAMGFLILSSAASVASSRRYRAECDRLSATHERLLEARREAVRISELEEDRFSEQVSEALRSAVADIAGRDHLDAAQRIRTIGDELVRPMAHSLVRSLQGVSSVGTPQEVPLVARPPSFGAILVNTLHPAYIRPLLVALTCSLLPLPGALTRFGLVQGLAVCGVVFLSILFSGLAARFVLSSRARPGTVLGVLMLALTIVITTLFVGLMFALVTGTTFVTATLAGGAVITIVTLIIAVGHAFTERREVILRQLEDANDELTWQIARTNGVRWSRQRAMARALHGPIQSALISAALRLEDDSLPDAAAEELTRETAGWLDSTIEQWACHSEQGRTLREQLALVTETWSGQCHAEIDWDGISAEQIDEDPICATILADLVIEGFSNSVRHGRAKNLRVTVERVTPGTIALRLHGDGQARGLQHVPGLGTAYLDEVTTLHAFVQDADGGLMIAEIPFEPTRMEPAIRG